MERPTTLNGTKYQFVPLVCVLYIHIHRGGQRHLLSTKRYRYGVPPIRP